MKKLFALFMTLCVSVALIGCGGDAGAKKDDKKGGAAPAAPAKPAEGEKKEH